MTNITNEQLEAWASLGPWRTCNVSPSLGHIYGSIGRLATSIGGELNRTQTNAALIAAAPQLAAALLAERKAREVEVGELHRVLGLARIAIDAAYMQSDAEWRGHDKVADKHDKIVREGRSAIRQALKGPTP